MDTSAAAWKEKGNGFYKQRRFDEALRCYLEAVEIDPLFADAWYNLGMTCKALGYQKESVTCFKRAENFNRGNNNAYAAPPQGRLPSTSEEIPDMRRGSQVTKKNKPELYQKPGKKRHSLKKFAPFILILLALCITFTAVLPAVNGVTGTGFFPFPGSGGADTRAPAGLPGQSIAKVPGEGYSVTPTVTPVSVTIPSQYQAMKTGAVVKSFSYVLRGEQGEINITLYQGVGREIAKEDPYSYVGEKDRYQKFIYLSEQDPFLVSLVDAIREKSTDPDDQARIAVSLVQQIPYDQEMLDKGTLEIRYPYQTLLDNKGVCCEKSVLLAYLLHKMGYGVALFDFENEKHTAVGILAAPEYAYKNTGYAFIETTTPLIITDGNGKYPAFGRIISSPEVLPAGEGKAFGSVREEWNDAREWQRLNSLGPVLERSDYNRWQSLCRKYGIVPGSS
jgi:hypothetical protein